jgi:hypothetical protein
MVSERAGARHSRFAGHDGLGRSRDQVDVEDLPTGVEADEMRALHLDAAAMRAEFEHGAVAARHLAFIPEVLDISN